MFTKVGDYWKRDQQSGRKRLGASALVPRIGLARPQGSRGPYEKGDSLFTRTNQLRTKSKAIVGSAVVATTLILSLGVGIPSSGAASSAFCSTLVSWAKNPPKSPPASINTGAYRTWAKQYIPFYSKLASEAPNGKTAKILNEVVTILKAYESASNLKALQADVVKNSSQWATDARALAGAVISCATSFG